MIFKRILSLFFVSLSSMTIFAQTDSRTFEGYNWFDDGISFTYPLAMAEDAVGQFVPATTDSPEIVRIVFQYYDSEQGWLSTGAQIDITLTLTQSQNQHDILLADSSILVLPIDFQNGTGSRQVITMENDTNINSLFYAYIGQTEDSMYAIRAIFPIIASQVNMESAIDLQTLNNLSASAFTPNLNTHRSLNQDYST